MYEMTNFIDTEIPNEVLKFTTIDKINELDDQYRILKSAYDIYIEDYNKFPSGNSIESLDMKYDDDKGRFYTKYIKFAQKCKELYTSLSISGYSGVNDVIKIKIHEICQSVDYNFPYGWKSNVR